MPTPTIPIATIRKIEQHIGSRPRAWIAQRFLVSMETVDNIANGDYHAKREMSEMQRAAGDASLLKRCPGCGGKMLKTRKGDCRHCETLAMFPMRQPCHEPAKITLRLDPEQQRRLVAIRKKIGLSGVC